MRTYPALMLRKPFRQNEMDILAYLPFLCFGNGQLHAGADGNACDNLSLMPTQKTGFLIGFSASTIITCIVVTGSLSINSIHVCRL